MTEFKRTTEELASVEEFISCTSTDASTLASDKLDKLLLIKVRLVSRI